MNCCRDCRYWTPITEDSYGSGMHRVVFPPKDGEEWWDVDTSEVSVRARGLHLVRRCEHPRIVFYQRPAPDGAAVFDGSEYKAALATAEGFGCVLFEANAKPENG